MAEPYVPPLCGASLHNTRLTYKLGSVPGISAVPHEENLRYFDVEIHGPSQSPYEGECSCASRPTIQHDIDQHRWHF